VDENSAHHAQKMVGIIRDICQIRLLQAAESVFQWNLITLAAAHATVFRPLLHEDYRLRQLPRFRSYANRDIRTETWKFYAALKPRWVILFKGNVDVITWHSLGRSAIKRSGHQDLLQSIFQAAGLLLYQLKSIQPMTHKYPMENVDRMLSLG
jgi:hypothetical protein